MAADHIDFWFDGQHVFLFKRDAARRSGATERHPIQLAAIPFAHHPSGNDSLLPISQPPPGLHGQARTVDHPQNGRAQHSPRARARAKI
jgi:hypothetical protein